jgi:hypothetical protein
MWWLPAILATLKPCRFKARTIRLPETEGVAFAVRSQAGAQLGMGAPQAVLLTLHDDRHRHRARFGRVATIPRSSDQWSARSSGSPLPRELVKRSASGPALRFTVAAV